MSSMRAAVLVLAILVISLAAILYWMSWPKSFHIQLVSKPFENNYEKFAPFSVGTSTMRIEVSGELTGRAHLYVGNSAAELDSGKGYSLGPGKVQFNQQFFEWWSNQCFIRYVPLDVTGGDLEVKISIY